MQQCPKQRKEWKRSFCGMRQKSKIDFDFSRITLIAIKVQKRRRLWPFHVSYSSSSRRNRRIAKKNLTIVISNIKSHRKTTSGRKKMVVCRTILKMLSVSFIVWVGILEAVDSAPVTGTWIKSRPQSPIQKIEMPIRSNRKRPSTARPSPRFSGFSGSLRFKSLPCQTA